jgi:hypothetical protein
MGRADNAQEADARWIEKVRRANAFMAQPNNKAQLDNRTK